MTRAATEGDDVAVRILDIEVHRSPRRRGQRPEDRHAAREATFVERLDPVDACRGIEVLMLAPVLALRPILWSFLQVQLQPVQRADGIEAVPGFAEREPEPSVVRD